MTEKPTVSCFKRAGLAALTGLSLWLHTPQAQSQEPIEDQATKTVLTQVQAQPLVLNKRSQASHDAYILGPGDGLLIELLDLPELSGRFSIGPDGTLYLPRLRALYVEGLTVEELRKVLTKQFDTYVRDPQVYVRPVTYRPIRIYIGGEVRRPGYYTLTGVQSPFIETEKTSDLSDFDLQEAGLQIRQRNQSVFGLTRGMLNGTSPETSSGTLFPTVFDAIRTAQGVTPYSNLTQVKVTRRRAQGQGGGRIRTKLNFLSLITEGNESQNIRLFDGDVVSVGRSKVVMREQLRQAGQTNLSPQYINVFVNGRVKNPGGVTIPHGSALNHAIALAGGPELLKGKVEFIRFTSEGEIDRRKFRYNPRAAVDAPNNPVLTAGDLITIRESPLSASVTVIDEIASPAVSIYSAYSLFKAISQ